MANVSLESVSNTSAKGSEGGELIYALPKEYNGKTVNDLFPEFKHNSVLRFSKLFGLGRVTSLPKIWKGTRKRKKTKTNATGNEKSDDVTNIIGTEETTNMQVNDVDEVFKILDEALKPSNVVTVPKGNSEDGAKEDEEARVENVVKEAQEELQFEEDDQIALMKPFYVENLSDPRTVIDKLNGIDAEPNNELDTANSTWRFGPASLWYDAFQPNLYILNKKSSKNNKVKSFYRLKKVLK